MYSSRYGSQVKLQFLTAHSSKGLSADNVIIINAKDDVYGFPSKVDDDPVLSLVVVNDNSYTYAEERRLFYVALTRTKKSCLYCDTFTASLGIHQRAVERYGALSECHLER